MKIAKKVCLIGRFAVGKTSLVRQYIENQFSEKYKTTVGVSISTKVIDIDDHSISMILWDIAGFEQEGHYKHYLRGTQGIIWVLDGTEPESFDIFEKVSIPDLDSIPAICLVNKCDLKDQWRLNEESLQKIRQYVSTIHYSSAKTGENVEDSFNELAKKLLGQ